MNTVYGRLVLWSVATVVIGFVLVSGISAWFSFHDAGRTQPSRYDRVLV